LKKQIQGINEIRFGYYAQPAKVGGVPYLQARQFNEMGLLTGKTDEFVPLDSKAEQQFLKDGDVLFVGKGNRLFAWCYRKNEGPYIASSIFFVLTPNQALVYPEYLAAALNLPRAKSAFQQIGSGTSIFSIRKSELGAFEIELPSMEKQKKIAAVDELYRKELALTQTMLNKKQYFYTGIISELLK
jgi:restriction endonuclease S subunit